VVINARTSVGLNAHVRSAAACGLDGQSGEVSERYLAPDAATVVDWVQSLPGPVAVTYEAGPAGFGYETGPAGFGLARAFDDAGIRCAAPSAQRSRPDRGLRVPLSRSAWSRRRRSCRRPAGDWIKTYVRDARHLAWLLHLSEIVQVAVPSRELEACRDLTRSRKAARRDLMSARHRVGKLLLSHGLVYPDKTAWTARHDEWRRRQRLPMRHWQMAFESAYGAVVAARERRDRLDEAIEAMAADCDLTPVVRWLGCLRGVSTQAAFALAVEIGDWHRL
jgi:transposase